MERPDLERVWHTFVEITSAGVYTGEHIELLRFKIRPVLVDLERRGIIKWYCFLIHGKGSGVPTKLTGSMYIHARLGLCDRVDSDELIRTFPSYFVGTEHVPFSNLNSIAGIDRTLLKEGAIEEAWRIIGEQCEWLLNLLNIYKENASLFPKQVGQFLHYFSNITQLVVQ
jgi:hypothetical protein